MANTASPPAKCGNRPAPLSFLTVVLTVFAALILFADLTVASASNEPHVRHKRTVSEFVEDLMNAVYFHLDPLPLPSTVIARISHMPPTSSRVSYKYIPMKKMKLTKVRARKLAEPKMKYKYPKKYPPNTEDSTAALTKNDLPWTLHPLPPPLSTSKSSTIEADKNVPWALHPLPPPVKTRNYNEYYWHDPKNRPIKYKNKFKPIKPFHFMNYNPFNSKPMDYKPTFDFKPADFKKLRDLESPDFKDEDFNTGDFKSVGYKPELHNDDDDRPSDADRDHHEVASSEENMASSKGPGFVATHITIEPSVEIASFSETELQGDGTTNDAVSHGDRQGKHRCQCIVNGHRHKRQVDSAALSAVVNGTAVGQPEGDRVQRSHDLYSSVGHATEVVIQRSHDITDRAATNGNPINYVQQLRGGQNAETISADGKRSSQQQSDDGGEKEADAPDNSDKSAMNYGREINNWDESRSSGRVTADDDKFSVRLNEDNEGGSIYGGQTDDGYGRSRLGPNANKERRLHLTKSTVDNTGGGVAFSVQTPFSVASFSSNVGHPGSRERQSRFRYTNSGSPSSSSPFSSDYSEPLDFEQFGLQSAVVGEDKLSETGQLFTQFSKGFDDRPTPDTGRLISDISQNFRDKSTDSGRLTTHFSRDFGNDGDRSKGFRYGGQTSDRPTGRLIGNRDRPNGSFLEYFQPVVIDFEKSSGDGKKFNSFGENNDGNDKLRYFGKSDSPFPRFKKHDNPDPLRLPGRLHESNEHLSRKMVFHPSTFDID